jgi:hypothetical protein
MASGTTSKSLTTPLLTVILLALGSGYATGTTIVAARNADEVVLAADSKDRHLENENTSTSCKIFSCGGYFIAIAGVRELRVGSVEFSAPSLVGQVCRMPGNAAETMARLTDSLIPPFTRVMTELARRNPQRYKQSVETKEAYINILMVGFEHETPFILERDLIAPSQISAGVATRNLVQNDKLPPTGLAYVFIGRHEGIDEFVRTRNALWRLGLIEAAKFLVAYEIADTPAAVGPPIDVVRVNKDGAQWIQRKPECPESGKPGSQPNILRRKY